ncbi:MAG TPA: ATP-binding protein [Vicinamibacterales bacterium]|nr:ATP-binding protein [Vicinamibacterales bacterium]
MFSNLDNIFSSVTADEALRRSEEGHRLLVSLNDAARSSTNAEDVMWAVVTRAGRHFQVSRCTYGEIDAAEEHVLVVRDYVDDAISIVGRHRIQAFGPELIADLKRGRTAVIPDLLTDPRTAAHADAFAGIQARSLICVPLVKDGKFVAIFVCHHKEPREWTEHEAMLAEQIAERTWFLVENARAVASLRESRDVLSLAMRGGRMGAWSRNMLTNEVWWSRELEELFGLEPGGFEGSQPGFRSFVHDEDKDRVEAIVEDAITTRRDYVMEFRFRHADGSWRWMDGRGRAIYGPDGAPRWLYGIGIDITERKVAELERARVQRERASLLEAAEAANRAKDEFLAMLGHELRNPLSPILTALQLMKLRGDDSSLRERIVIERQVTHLTRLVDDLLDVSRIARGKVELKTANIELTEVVARAIEVASPLLEQRTQTLTIDAPRTGLPVDGDPARLTQVVSNLLTNASKYTAPGGHISVIVGPERGEAVIRVRDNGVGIAADVLPRVFDLFVQGGQASDRAEGGLGLGLAIVRSLTERHGGSVSVHSDGLGKGSEFVVRLPLAQAPIASAMVSQSSGPVADASAATGTRVLIVDDNVDAAEMLAHALGLNGHHTHVAHDGPDALRQAVIARPSVAFLDIGLPVMDGYELAARLRETPGLEGIRLVAVTGYGQESDRQRSAAAGFHHHLVKPVDLDEVQGVLEGLQKETST